MTEINLLDHGYCSDISLYADEPPQSEYWRAIPLAIARGYKVDPENGCVFGLDGKKLSTKCSEGKNYPTVRFYVDGLSRRDFSIHLHKVIAFVIWGWKAFAKDIEVRHIDGNRENNKRCNLALGSSSQNQMDKNSEVRSFAARMARKAQPKRSFNAILTEEEANLIMGICNANRTTNSGRIKKGIVKGLALKYGVSSSTISLIGRGKTWKK